jgi:exopolyphosphatase/guanosine-5'-triphosphate,3'-diphosphate pyrophosphatase
MPLFDLGGGSTEVVLADEHGCLLTASLRVGALRLRSGWICEDPPSPADLALLELRAAEALSPATTHVRRQGFDLVVLSCGTARSLLKLALAHGLQRPATTPLGPREPSLSLATLRALEQRLACLREAQRRELLGPEPRRFDTLLAGAVALRVILEQLGADQALVSNCGLREGLIADYLNKRRATSLARVVHV